MSDAESGGRELLVTLEDFLDKYQLGDPAEMEDALPESATPQAKRSERIRRAIEDRLSGMTGAEIDQLVAKIIPDLSEATLVRNSLAAMLSEARLASEKGGEHVSLLEQIRREEE